MTDIWKKKLNFAKKFDDFLPGKIIFFTQS